MTSVNIHEGEEQAGVSPRKLGISEFTKMSCSDQHPLILRVLPVRHEVPRTPGLTIPRV